MKKSSVLLVGGGCLGCLAVPSLLAIGGAAGWLLANNRQPEIAGLELDTDAIEDRELALETAPVNETRREALVIEPVRPASTPTPLAEMRTIATPAPAPTATAAPVVARKLETAKPAPVARKAEALKAAPLPKSTPRRFDDVDLEEKLSRAKPVKIASASGATAAGQQTEEDLAAAALFGDAPGVPVKPAAAVAPAPAPAVSSKVRSIKTRGGKVDVTIGHQVVVQGSDKKTLLGTLEKVEAGWVFVRGSDGKTKSIAENDILDASEL